MAVIRRTVADYEFRPIVFNDAVNVCVQASLDLRMDKIDAVFAREDNVHQNSDQ